MALSLFAIAYVHRCRNFCPKASPRSKLLKLPEISRTTTAATSKPDTATDSQTKDEGETKGKKLKNPFHMPTDVEVFAMREEERRQKQEVGLRIMS